MQTLYFYYIGMLAMSTVPLSIRIDQEVKNLLDIQAQHEDRSASYIATKAIKKYLEAQRQEEMMIDAAIKEADKGVFVSSKAMRTWFASLGTDNELPRPKPDVFLKK